MVHFKGGRNRVAEKSIKAIDLTVQEDVADPSAWQGH